MITTVHLNLGSFTPQGILMPSLDLQLRADGPSTVCKGRRA